VGGVFGALLSNLASEDAGSKLEAEPSDDATGALTLDISTAQDASATPILQVGFPTVPTSVLAILRNGPTKDGLSMAQSLDASVPVAVESATQDKNVLLSGDALSASSTAKKGGIVAVAQQATETTLDDLAPSFAAKSLLSLQKDRGRFANSAAVPAMLVAQDAVVSKMDVAQLLERRDVVDAMRGLEHAVMPEAGLLETAVQPELRREKSIFISIGNSFGTQTNPAADFDIRSVGIGIDSTTSGSGSTTAQGDQNSPTYWVSSDMKNAELKLEGPGESPVEVTISVHGNQTHVAFRTDETDARMALESQGGALNDMLRQEGLVLTSVTVGDMGSSAGSGASGQHARPNQRPIDMSLHLEKHPPIDLGKTSDGRIGRLDIFV
jgi:flagellar hook-length control protein FliK